MWKTSSQGLRVKFASDMRIQVHLKTSGSPKISGGIEVNSLTCA